MRPFHLGVVDKRLAHKHQESNVFVRDLRRAVPGTLAKEAVETHVLPVLSEEDRRFFCEYYQPWVSPSGEHAYTLFNIPHQLPANLFEDQDQFTPAEKKTLARFYEPGPESHQLKRPVTEMEDVVLARILDPKGLALTEEERMRLANLLEAIPHLTHDDIFHGGLFVDPNHSFFFEHPNEHVPGMMVLEAGRQFGMACWHRFGKTPFSGVQFILNTFETRFHDFIELSYPAFLKGEVLQVDLGTGGEWNSVRFKVSVFQRGEVCAEMEIQGQVIAKRAFQRLRAGRQKTNPLHRFFPIASIHHKITLWDPVKEKYLRVKLWDISMEGTRVEFQEPLDESALPHHWEVILYFEDVGFIRSKGHLAWHRKERETQWAGFRFVNLGPEDRNLLQTAIRQYCQVRREREQL